MQSLVAWSKSLVALNQILDLDAALGGKQLNQVEHGGWTLALASKVSLYQSFAFKHNCSLQKFASLNFEVGSLT